MPVAATRAGQQRLLWCASLVAALLLRAPPAAAQTLDQQYDFYLRNSCAQMQFQRGTDSQPLPTEAGPNLRFFCRTRVYPTSVSPPVSLGGAAAAGASTESAGREAARRRREKDQPSGNDSARDADSSDVELGSFGRASLFLSLDYRHERQKTTFYESGRVTRALDGTLGIDYRLGTLGVLGMTASYGRASGDIDAGGDFKGRNWGAWVFSSWWPLDGAFIDVAGGFDRNDLDLTRIVQRVVQYEPLGQPPRTYLDPDPAPAASQPRRNALSGELRAGYDFSPGGWTFGPRLGVTAKRLRLDGVTETGETPMTLNFAAHTSTSLQSLAGIQVGRALPTALAVFVPQLNADWVHEYRDDQQLLTAAFAEDLRPQPKQLQFLNNRPDRDWFLARVSLGVVFVHEISAFASFENAFGHDYIDRYRASLGLRMQW